VDKARDVLGWYSSLALEEAIASALAWSERRHEVLGYP
jgi:UDP-glucose 4-epimerase